MPQISLLYSTDFSAIYRGNHKGGIIEEFGEQVEQVAADGDTQKTDAVGTAADSNHGQCDEVTSA